MALNLDTALLSISMDTFDPQTGNTLHLNGHSMTNKMMHLETERNYLPYRNLSVYIIRQYHALFAQTPHKAFTDIAVSVLQPDPQSEYIQFLAQGSHRYQEHLDRCMDSAIKRSRKTMHQDSWHDTCTLDSGFAAYLEYQNYLEEQNIASGLFTETAEQISMIELNTLLDKADYMDHARSKKLVYNHAKV